jgi:outer membrane protein assembly factor BamB
MAVDAFGTLLVGGLDGFLYAISKDGEFLWKFDIGSPIHAAPLIGPKGRIYVCTVDGTLYALS